MRALLLAGLLCGCGRTNLMDGTVKAQGAAADPCAAVEDGAPCDVEGAHCGSCNGSPCQFCTSFTCRSGAWHGIEAPPAPHDVCDLKCGALTCDRYVEACVKHVGRDP